MKKRPRFFCENCGSEVPRDAKHCPSCGRYFASVRCPKCDFTGAENLFAQGCPSCGYSAPPSGGTPLKQREVHTAGRLPPWVYLVTALAVLAVSAALYFILR
ncbi:zinc ribbon domain-containing protein [Breznakiella homolactica]|uniref:Zinc ribbon domain-containing protein n=1 Tax=Breznakiella homolactica TaxID=2798577 RepID=A0A7T7XLA7_9SPIR|nr:zinc ribbon domain-containing protein [Breznakiella homolactica]QQO08367.1 zinc ribbon domain-containing protein [Breznakiella homolactica]